MAGSWTVATRRDVPGRRRRPGRRIIDIYIDSLAGDNEDLHAKLRGYRDSARSDEEFMHMLDELAIRVDNKRAARKKA